MKKEPSTHPRDQPPHFHFSFLLLDFLRNQTDGKRKYLPTVAGFIAATEMRDHWFHRHSKDDEESPNDPNPSPSVTFLLNL